jgi:hypothetical protein
MVLNNQGQQGVKIPLQRNTFDPRKSNLKINFLFFTLVTSLHASMWRKGILH